MRVVSPFLKRVVYPGLAMAGAFRRTTAAGLAVVTYHGVFPKGYVPVDAGFDGNLVSAEVLRRQLCLLKKNYNVISPADALAWREGRLELPPRAALLTCDDGLLNCLTDMLPLLREQQVSCLFFVTGASAGQLRNMLWYEDLFLLFLRAPAGHFEIAAEGIAIQGELSSREARRALWWNSVKQLSRIDEGRRSVFLRAMRMRCGSQAERGFDESDAVSCRRFGLLTLAELRELVAAGMTIGAHTLSHPMLSQLPPDAAYAEISESRLRLESALQQPVWAFAYPFGDSQSVTPEVLAMAEKAGYAAAFLNFGGGLGVALPPYALPRLYVTAAMNLAEFEAHVSGFYSRLQRRVGRGVPGLRTQQNSGSSTSGAKSNSVSK
jgi:peptidoglycan/xylan/chitin deacetylase (PgdA/CDA1 family)